MRRRNFIAALGGVVGQLLVAALVWPVAAKAQQPGRARRLGILVGLAAQTDSEGEARVAAFLKTLQTFGWTADRNIQIDIRWSAGDIALVNVHAAELIGLTPDALLVAGNVAMAELQRLTKTIPMVFVNVSDPVGSGFVRTLGRPEGNITGFENFEPAMGGKWLGMLHEVAPNVTRAAVLMNPETPAHATFFRAAGAVAPLLGIQLTPAGIRDADDISRAVTALASTAGGGLVILPHPVTTKHRDVIIELALRHRLPAVYPARFFAQNGGLVSYGNDPIDQWPRAAKYIDQIFRGKSPSELPVQAPTKFDLTINLKAAKAIGLVVPPAFALRADEVIE
jgi:putative ABC transport system substrate-binding protein